MGVLDTEFQGSTDTLQAAGRTTVDTLFWRSGFGPSILGGPTHAGGTPTYNARATEFENLTGGTTPVGIKPIFLEYASQSALTYLDPTQNTSDYTTQRWNASGAPLEVTAQSLGMGAAAETAWAGYLLRTNHHPNSTQDAAGPLIGASGADGILGLWLVDGLKDRVMAVKMGAAYNGSALGAFNLTDGALVDTNGSNGWQAVPDRMSVMLSNDTEPLFLGFAPVTNTTSVEGQAAIIMGLAEIVALSDPAGAHGFLFDGSPFDASLYGEALPLLNAAINNAQASLWDAAAETYNDADGTVTLVELLYLVNALAKAESAADAAVAEQANATAAREQALEEANALIDAQGGVPHSYDVSGTSVSVNSTLLPLEAQAGAVAALGRVYDLTGLHADYEAMFKVGSALEARLFWNDSYHAGAPEGSSPSFSAHAIAATLAGQRDLALTLDEPLAIFRIVNATERLVPSLILAGANAPPVIGASFAWNVSSTSPLSSAADFDAAAALHAAHEFVSMGPEFYAAVGGGSPVSYRAAQVLHNATAASVGALVDSLDQQIAALQAQIAAVQASFDALNNNVTNITNRLNLSLENETIDLARIADLQANLTALRYTVENATKNETVAIDALASVRKDLTNLTENFTAVSYNLTLALNNASVLAGRLNTTLDDRQSEQTGWANANSTIDTRAKEAAGAEGRTAIAAVVGLVAGLAMMFFLQRFELIPSSKPKEGKDDDDLDEKDAGKGSKDRDEK